MTTLDKILEEGYIYIQDYEKNGFTIYGKGDLRLLYSSKDDVIIVKYKRHTTDKVDNGEDIDKYDIKKPMDDLE